MSVEVKLNSRSLKVEKGNAVAMTRGFPKDGKTHFVTIFTAHENAVSLKNDFRHRPKLITPKETSPREIYPLSSGIGKGLDVKDCEYNSTATWIAILDSIFHIQHNMEIWERLCTNDVFDIWNPAAPYNMLTHDAQNRKVDRRDPMILLLRVCEVDHDFSNEISKGPYWNTIQPRTVKIVRTRIGNEEFEGIRKKIVDALNDTLGVGNWPYAQVNDTQKIEKELITDKVVAKRQEMAKTHDEPKKTVTAKLLDLWELNSEGTKADKFNQLSQRVIGLISLEGLEDMVNNNITKELWNIIDRDELIRKFGHPDVLDYANSFLEPVREGGARSLMLNLLEHIEGSKATSSQQVCERIYGLYSLRKIDELEELSKRIWRLVDSDELFMWAGLFGVVGENILDYLM